MTYQPDEKHKAEENNPKLLSDIIEIMEPHSQSDSHLRTRLLYTEPAHKLKKLQIRLLSPI